MKTTTILFTLALAIFFAACDIKDSNVNPEESFARVYESMNVDEQYFPLDAVQSESGEYLVVSAIKNDSVLTNFPQFRLTALDADGSLISSVIPGEYTGAVPGFFEVGGRTYLACMNDESFRTRIIEVNLNGDQLSYNEAQAKEMRNPLYTYSDGQHILLLSWDVDGSRSLVDIFDANFNSVGRVEGRNGNSDVLKDAVFAHLKRNDGRSYPFFIDGIQSNGVTSGFIFNWMDNYSLETVSVNIVGDRQWSITSHHLDGVNAVTCLGDTAVALSRYFEGDNFLYPHASFEDGETYNAKNFSDIFVPLLEYNAPVDVMKYEVKDKEFIVYASTTSQQEVILIFFDAETGEQANTKIIGETNSMKVVKAFETNDGGLAILGSTRFNGKYDRIAMIKLTKKELEF